MIKVGIDAHKLEDTTGAQRAGIGRHVYRLLEEISKRDDVRGKYRFYLYFKGRIPDNIPFLDNDLFVPRVAKLPFFLPFFRPSFNVFFHIALPWYAIKDRIDVTFFPSFMLPALFVKKSVVVLTNDIYYEFSRGTLPLKYRVGYKLFATWAAKTATTITTQTYASRDEISEYFNLDKEKITVVPLGADFQRLYRNDSAEKKPYILYVGQAFPRRHLKETLEAFGAIAPEFPDYSFVAIGVEHYNPPVIEDLVRRINRELGAPKVIRKEFVSDEKLDRLYRRAKLFTYISSSEAMGLPPLEALASGTVPVVADTPTTREIFGRHALFVQDPDDPEQIAETLKEGLSNEALRERILENREEVLQKYTWQNHAEKMMKLFSETARK